MRKSVIDRIFPSSEPILPRHEHSEPFRSLSRSPAPSPSSRTRDSVSPRVPAAFTASSPLRPSSNISSSPEIKHKGLATAPLSASVLHHDDPFLPIDRAARALQDTIQSLLDIQSRALTGRMNGHEQEEVTSGGSLTPTQSAVTPRSTSGMRAVPIRQPQKKNIGLRGARKGLTRKMREFAELREEELQVLDTQSRARIAALDQAKDLEAKKEACVAQIDSIRQEDTSATAANLRTEAKNVESEIHELEHRLLELRVRHRHLLSQADQLDSSLDSKISSFQGTIKMVDKETRNFLKRPPVPHALADGSDVKQLGMYALTPERRTLEMAREQWTAEHEILTQRTAEVASEHDALLEGGRLWAEAVVLIDEFEKKLRDQTAQLTSQTEQHPQASMERVMHELSSVIEKLESDLALAESKDWNLLICAIGAEVDAFRQALEMLEQTKKAASSSFTDMLEDGVVNAGQASQPGRNGDASNSSTGSLGSNQSLNDTLNEFRDNVDAPAARSKTSAMKYESEDDEPPADFLLSR